MFSLEIVEVLECKANDTAKYPYAAPYSARFIYKAKTTASDGSVREVLAVEEDGWDSMVALPTGKPLLVELDKATAYVSKKGSAIVKHPIKRIRK